jgi:hypothetical protein
LQSSGRYGVGCLSYRRRKYADVVVYKVMLLLPFIKQVDNSCVGVFQTELLTKLLSEYGKRFTSIPCGCG